MFVTRIENVLKYAILAHVDVAIREYDKDSNSLLLIRLQQWLMTWPGSNTIRKIVKGILVYRAISLGNKSCQGNIGNRMCFFSHKQSKIVHDTYQIFGSFPLSIKVLSFSNLFLLKSLALHLSHPLEKR